MSTVKDKLQVMIDVKGAKQANKDMDTFNKSMGVSIKQLLGIGSAMVIAYKGISVIKQSIQLALDQEVANAKLANTLLTTGNNLNTTTQLLNKFANELQRATGIDDTLISSLVISNLLTFKSITDSGIFERATTLVLDMSKALGTDLKSSAIQLGKALEDPIAGISALARNGITFTTSQKLMIKSLVQSNNLAKAHGVILDEVATAYEGLAAEMATEFDIFKQLFNDSLQNLGLVLLPKITQAMIVLNREIIAFNDSQNAGTQGTDLFSKALNVGKLTLYAGGILLIGNSLFKTGGKLNNFAKYVKLTTTTLKFFFKTGIGTRGTKLSQMVINLSNNFKNLNTILKSSVLLANKVMLALGPWMPLIAAAGVVIRQYYLELTNASRRTKDLREQTVLLKNTFSELEGVTLSELEISRIIGDTFGLNANLVAYYNRNLQIVKDTIKNFKPPKLLDQMTAKIISNRKKLAELSKTVVLGTKSATMIALLAETKLLAKQVTLWKKNNSIIAKSIDQIKLWNELFDKMFDKKDFNPLILIANELDNIDIGLVTYDVKPLTVLEIIPLEVVVGATDKFGEIGLGWLQIQRILEGWVNLFTRLTTITFSWSALILNLMKKPWKALGTAITDTFKNVFDQIVNDLLKSGLIFLLRQLLALATGGTSKGFLFFGIVKDILPKTTSFGSSTSAANANYGIEQRLDTIAQILTTNGSNVEGPINDIQLSRNNLIGSNVRVNLGF